MIKSFLTGAIVGGAVMWLWGSRIRSAVDEATSGVRARAAEGLQDAADTLQSVADTVEGGLSGAQQPRVS